ncbi:MAG: anhydro-N-acetylmuramic acid kinase [Gammaproteobacteria bacterium]
MADNYIGLMSGTSMDSIDAVLVDFSSPTPRLIEQLSYAWPEDLKTRLQTLAENPHSSITEFATLDIETGRWFASAVTALIEKSGLATNTIKAIGSHGQTVLHQPDSAVAFSQQIGDPNTITEQTGITTVADFRRRDIAAGGQGAPLAPAFHRQVFCSPDENRVVLNIGGMSNITVLPTVNSTVTGFDTGPGNVLLDAWISQHSDITFDNQGEWARSGTVHSALLQRLREHDFFNLKPPKSTGRETFNLDWLQNSLQSFDSIPAADIQATLVALTTITIAEAIQAYASNTQRLLVCGGGVHNTYLLEQLQKLLPDLTIESTEKYGVHPDWVEAIAFAWFAKQTLEKKPANLPSVTGAKQLVILGGIYQA